MRITSIANKNKEVFHRLAPEYLMCDLEQDYRFAFGAIGGEDTQRYVGGVLIFDIVSGSTGIEDITVADIKWLYTAENHRREGVADALMEAFFEITQQSGVLHMMCDVPFSEEHDLLCNYLEAWNFEFHLQNMYELEVSVGELSQSPMLHKKPSPCAVALDSVDNIAFRKFITAAKQLPYVLSELSIEKKHYDGSLSCVYRVGESLVGGILVRCNNAGNLELMLLRSLTRDPAVMFNLMLYCIQSASKKYSPDTMVEISCRADFSGNVIDQLLPNHQPAIIRRGYLGSNTTIQE